MQLQRETLAQGIRREMGLMNENLSISDEQAEAAARILRPMLDDTRTGVTAPSHARHLHAI